jgi:hypothetical protein
LRSVQACAQSPAVALALGTSFGVKVQIVHGLDAAGGSQRWPQTVN